MISLVQGNQECPGGPCFVDRVALGDLPLPDATLGLGVIDFDNDGWMDLLFGNPAGQSIRLLRNVEDPDLEGGRLFMEVTAGSGLDDAESVERFAFGFSVFDYDNDGDSDVYSLGYTRDPATHGLLYRNNGDGTFSNVTMEAGLRGAGYSPQSSGAADFDHDGDVDLMVANAGGGRSILLYRNNGDGTFADVSDLTPDLGAFNAVYTVLWSDFDGDGWEDAFPLVYGRPATLLRNVSDERGGRRFINVAEDVGFTGLGFAPMGLVAGDVDNDGDIDYFASNGNRGRYYRNDGGALVSYDPFRSIFGWGNALLDADNDGDLDYYMAGSWGSPAFDKLFENLGDGTWDDISGNLNGILAASRFALQVDADNDGRVDIVTMNPGTAEQRLSFYRNLSPSAGHYVAVQLRGDGTFVSRDAVGAKVRLVAGRTTQVREKYIGSSTASTDDPRLHFGVGAHETVERIEVVWPRVGTLASRTEVFQGPFAVDQVVTLAPRQAPYDCVDIRKLSGDCRPSTRRIIARLRSSLPPGDQVLVTLDGVRSVVAEVDDRGRARAKFDEAGIGDHRLTLHGCPDVLAHVTCAP
ncbi:MAG: hypothetical protein FLDDKLPJ_01745 [Phycisphaerae bacterium]|nr:hypothetical protein [Phycisphaerae bacterium]